MSAPSLSAITSYFRACYQADNREINLPNFLSSKVEAPYFLENTDLLEGHIPIYPVSEEWFNKVNKQLELYKKEKELYLASHFLVGYAPVAGKTQRILAPLFLHPAKTTLENNEFYVEINSEKRLFNPSFVRILKAEDSEENEVYEDIMEATPTGFIDFGKNIEIKDALLKHFPNLNTEDLLLYPDIPDEKTVKKLLNTIARRKDSSFSVLPIQILGILRKSVHTQGVLNELKQISVENDFSQPTKDIFLAEHISQASKGQEQIFVPVTLNAAQVKAFSAVRKHNVSYLFGPPGTGKSFTIAALAIDYLSRGKSVLIASSNNQAVDVIADKIEQDFKLPDVLVRGGRQDYKKQLKLRIQALLSGMTQLQGNPQIIQSLERKCRQLFERITTNEKRFLQLEEREIKHGQVLQESGFWAGMKQWWGKIRTSEKTSLWRLLDNYQQDLNAYSKAIQRLVKERFDAQLKKSLKEDREQLQGFEKAIKARTATKKDELFKEIDFDKLTFTFPIWLVSLSEVSNVLPLHKEMFDLIIIDEATQCDIATALPVLHRGKKVIISGDSKQLRHVSFLSQKRQRLLQEQMQLENYSNTTLDYRNHSLLDLVTDSIKEQSQISFLNEHYRSFPHIINFSNKTFYNNALHVILSTPQTQREERVFIHQTSGTRNAKGHNHDEASMLIENVKTIINEDQKLPKHRCRTIGILSPFREQVNYLLQLQEEAIDSNNAERHKILTGTAHSFQGEERDIMFISFVLDEQSHPTAFRHLNRDDVFNVSITRAKAEQHLFISIPQEKLQSKYLLTKYLEEIRNFKLLNINNTKTDEIKDQFMSAVLYFLKEKQFNEIYTAYPVAGIEVDILLIHNNHSYCIDLIGFPGQFEAAFPIERYKMLNRVGIKVFPLNYSLWIYHKEITEKAISDFLE